MCESSSIYFAQSCLMPTHTYNFDAFDNVANLLRIFHDLLRRVEAGHRILKDTHTDRVCEEGDIKGRSAMSKRLNEAYLV